MPALAPMDGFDQRTPYHAYDVWEHTVRAVEQVPPVESLRLTMLLHDAGKPARFTLDEQGVGHAKGHQAVSAELAKDILMGLKADRATQELVTLLVQHHDHPLSPDRVAVKRLLNRFGEDRLRLLLQVRQADELAKGVRAECDIRREYEALAAAVEAVIAEKPCVTLRELAIGGRELLAEGCRGKAVGDTLSYLLGEVIDERLPNDREMLLAAARLHMKNGNDIQ